MDNNQAPSVGGAPNQNQPEVQSVAQPVAQPMVQPVAQPVIAGAGAAGAKKKQGIIIGCTIGGIVIVAAVVVLLIVLLTGRGAGKTVSCKSSTTIMGIDVAAENVFNIKDGEISSSVMKGTVDLKSMSSSYKAYEEQLAEQITSSVKANCTSHCKFSSKYNKGNNIEYTMEYDNVGAAEYVGTGGEEKSMTAQEIADNIVKSADSATTCTQR